MCVGAGAENPPGRPPCSVRPRSGGLHDLAAPQRPVRGDDLPVGEQLAGVLEEQDARLEPEGVSEAERRQQDQDREGEPEAPPH